MDDTLIKILQAILIGGILIYLWPRVGHMIKNSPKGTTNQWLSALIPLLIVVGFIVLLVLST